jgi:hypothetical protein
MKRKEEKKKDCKTSSQHQMSKIPNMESERDRPVSSLDRKLQGPKEMTLGDLAPLGTRT